MQLRYYQAEAKAAIYKYLEQNPGKNPCVVLPTGSGKTPLLSSICADIAGQWGGRVLVLAHVKELLEQARDKLQRFLPRDMIGAYSAGLKSRDTSHPVICAGIQSVFTRAGELGKFDAIIVDEAHLIPSHENGMYRTFLDGALTVNPRARIIGMTATPYRLDTGYICGPDNVLNEICYEIGVKELIVQGFLCPIRTRAGKEHADLDGVHIRGGEYIESEMAERMDSIVDAACAEIVELTADRNKVLIFASSLAHGRHIQRVLQELTKQEVGFISGDMSAKDRAYTIDRFRGGYGYHFLSAPYKYLINMNVLTTGFDAPNIDAVVLLRATLSPGLYYQMVGRGLRIDELKSNCIVLDYGENTLRHGPIDAMIVQDKSEKGEGEAPAKECPQCHAVVFAGVSSCPECGFDFPPPEPKYKARAGRAGVLSGEIRDTEYRVSEVKYFVHVSRKDASKPTTMRVDYICGSVFGDRKSEWVCLNHSGYARESASNWWRARSRVPVPESVEDAVALANAGALCQTYGITWREEAGKDFGKIIKYDLSQKLPGMDDIEVPQEIADTWGDEPELVIVHKPDNSWFGDFASDDIPF